MNWPVALFGFALLLIFAGIALVCSAEQAHARRVAAGDLDSDTLGLMLRFFGGFMAVVVAAILLFVLSLHHLTRV